MKISLANPYKSLLPFTSDELSDLTIITGKNGSGKSQLLSRFDPSSYNAFHQPQRGRSGSMVQENIDYNSLTISESIGKIQVEGIEKLYSVQINYDQWKQILLNIISSYKSLADNQKLFIKRVLDANLSHSFIRSYRDSLLFNDSNYITSINSLLSQYVSPQLTYDSIIDERQLIQLLFTDENVKAITIANDISKENNKDFLKLSDIDFFNFPITESFIDNNNLFASKLELIFYNYAKRRDVNRKNFFYKMVEGEQNNSISNNDFEKQFPSPWKLINEIFTEHNFNFYFKDIASNEFSTDIDWNFLLLKKDTDEPIPLNDLSSGEKQFLD